MEFRPILFLSAVVMLLNIPTGCCKRNKDTGNGNNEPEVSDVRAQLIFSIPGEKTDGLEDIHVIPYGNKLMGDILSLPSITSSDGWDEAIGTISCDGVNLPVGASSALVYAKAIEKGAGGTPASMDDKFHFGILDVTGFGSGAPSTEAISFSPVPVYTGTSQRLAQLIAILNDVANATPESALSDGTRPKFKELTEEQSATVYSFWSNFKKISVVSSRQIGWFLKETYQNLDGCSTPAAQNTVPDTYAMAIAVRKAIADYCDIDSFSGFTFGCELKSEYQGFPGEIHLPEGAFGITYNSSSGLFEAKAAAAYVFPPNRQYFSDSPLLTALNALPSGLADKSWGDILKAFSPGAVKSSSAAVAIEKPARLATAGLTIRADGLDKNAKLEDFAHNEVDFTNGFQVTAVLVGNQKAVSWDFKPGGTKEYTSYHRIYNPTTAAAATFKKAQSTEAIPLNLLPTDRSSVSFALQLLNNCPDFVGKDGQIIPNNAVFYLPVTLKSSDGSPILPSGVQMTASLSILPQTGLRNAVLEVPDLNASQEYNESFTISRTTL